MKMAAVGVLVVVMWKICMREGHRRGRFEPRPEVVSRAVLRCRWQKRRVPWVMYVLVVVGVQVLLAAVLPGILVLAVVVLAVLVLAVLALALVWAVPPGCERSVKIK